MRLIRFFTVAPIFTTLLSVALYGLISENHQLRATLGGQVETPSTSHAVQPAQYVSDHKVAQGVGLSSAISDAGIAKDDIYPIAEAFSKQLRPQAVRAGMPFMVYWQDESKTAPTKLEFELDKIKYLRVSRNDDATWSSAIIDLPVQVREVSFSGQVFSSLWDAAEDIGMDAQLITQLAAIFAWQIDFNRAVQIGDRFRLVVEQKTSNGEAIGWGKILAAEYENVGERYAAVRFPKDGDDADYYAPDGSSLKSLFLKSPLNFGRITSKFKASRFHPILKRNIPHNGVDYGAPIGTPVLSVGDGTVESAGMSGASGIMVRIRHNSTYKTAYLHLNGIAKNIKRGSKIKQGQVIGYVGMSGLATGPHLHFSFYENGVYIDPGSKKFPSQAPVSPQKMPAFRELTTTVLGLLPEWKFADERKPDHSKSI